MEKNLEVVLKDQNNTINLTFANKEKAREYVIDNLIRFHYLKFLFIIPKSWDWIEQVNIKDLYIKETKRLSEKEQYFI